MADKKAALDLGKVGLWKGVAPEDMWNQWKADLHRKVDEIFRPDRVRAVAQVRSLPESPQAAP